LQLVVAGREPRLDGADRGGQHARDRAVGHPLPVAERERDLDRERQAAQRMEQHAPVAACRHPVECGLSELGDGHGRELMRAPPPALLTAQVAQQLMPRDPEQVVAKRIHRMLELQATLERALGQIHRHRSASPVLEEALDRPRISLPQGFTRRPVSSAPRGQQLLVGPLHVVVAASHPAPC